MRMTTTQIFLARYLMSAVQRSALHQQSGARADHQARFTPVAQIVALDECDPSTLCAVGA
jgi:hypothetical protein